MNSEVAPFPTTILTYPNATPPVRFFAGIHNIRVTDQLLPQIRSPALGHADQEEVRQAVLGAPPHPPTRVLVMRRKGLG